MSLRAYLWVWDLPTDKTTLAERILLLALAEHAGPDGGDIYPTNQRLERMTGLNRGSVQRARRSLIAKGLLAEEGHHQPVGNPRAIRMNHSLPITPPPGEQPRGLLSRPLKGPPGDAASQCGPKGPPLEAQTYYLEPTTSLTPLPPIVEATTSSTSSPGEELRRRLKKARVLGARP